MGLPSLLRCYDYPTCTLEVRGRQSPLSRWTGRPSVRNLHFTLTLDDPRHTDREPLSLAGDSDRLLVLEDIVTAAVGALLAPVSVSTGSSTPSAIATHTLPLGELATENTGPALKLGTLQLFDLANAIDDCTADVNFVLATAAPRSLTTVPTWTAAAATFIAVVGLSAIALRFDQFAAQTAGEQSDAETEVAVGLERLPQPRNDIELDREFVEPLAEVDRLPPPPALRSPRPSLPDASPDLVAPPPTVSTATPSVEDEPNEAVAIEAPASTPQLPADPPTLPSELPELSATNEAADGATAPGKNAGAPSTAAESGVAIASEPGVAVAPEQAASLRLREEGSALSDRFDRRANAPGFATGDARPQTDEQRRSAIAVVPYGPAPEASEPTTESLPAAASESIATAGEVRAYFQSRWQPPNDLNSTLEYRLILDANGALERAIALGTDSQAFQSAAQLPPVGTQFASPTPGQRATVRLVLTPDGSVRTFLESPE
ncbi:hypothetical protein KR51_00017280 [Rubidibacter lacunae KORDI 51-2]|uniref:DUF4335 domain-containing protein n=1 Tax=Rubidibacter lacunae KORDI 51-2 TaxID=582515 RepID=U5DPN5_9CHRO|nr:DUF4335 domain-containing protein [Rubidibacter lacunae]ERN41650.1 hypothetical protein KR51_00017280 [Rubidibacter lacunae KORDI 51-2]